MTNSRAYARAIKRRQAARRYEAARAKAERCPWRVGRNVCGGLLEITVDRQGRTITRCPRCERREAGICQDCPRPVETDHRLSLRCKACKYVEKIAARHRYYDRHAERLRPVWCAHQRRYRAARPELREYQRRYQREYHRKRKLRALRGGT